MEHGIQGLVYLDQNVLGNLLPDSKASFKMCSLIKGMKDRGAALVYSHITVEECRAFGEPEKLVQVLEDFDFGFIQGVLTEERQVEMLSLSVV